MDEPMISIILLVWKEAEKCKRCIDRIMKLTTVPFQLIIIDNNSEKDIKDHIYSIKDDRVKVITHEKNEGIAKSYNIGAREAKGEYLAYVNSDYYLTDDWAENMIKCINETKAGMVGPCCMATGNMDQYYPTQFHMPLRYIETDYVTNLMFLRKSVLEEVGYFDEAYNPYTYDDMDLAEAIKSKGYKIFVDGWTWHWHDYNMSKENEDFVKVRERNKQYFREKWGDEIAEKYENKFKEMEEKYKLKNGKI